MDEPDAVEGEERPGLRSQQRGGDAERERIAVAPVEMALDRPQHEPDEQPFGVAAREALDEVVGEHERRGGDEAGGDPGQPAGKSVGHRDGQQPAGARDQQPQQGCGAVTEEGEHGGEGDRKRLPGRARGGDEVEVGDLTPPDEPRPGVVGRPMGTEQGECGKSDATDEEQAPGARRPGRAHEGRNLPGVAPP